MGFLCRVLLSTRRKAVWNSPELLGPQAHRGSAVEAAWSTAGAAWVLAAKEPGGVAGLLDMRTHVWIFSAFPHLYVSAMRAHTPPRGSTRTCGFSQLFLVCAFQCSSWATAGLSPCRAHLLAVSDLAVFLFRAPPSSGVTWEYYYLPPGVIVRIKCDNL